MHEVLDNLSYPANWKLVMMCVNDKAVDSGYTWYIYYVSKIFSMH